MLPASDELHVGVGDPRVPRKASHDQAALESSDNVKYVTVQCCAMSTVHNCGVVYRNAVQDSVQPQNSAIQGTAVLCSVQQNRSMSFFLMTIRRA